MNNPYANARGECPGRLGKAWQRGFEGLPPTCGTAKGTAAAKAYAEGKEARARLYKTFRRAADILNARREGRAIGPAMARRKISTRAADIRSAVMQATKEGKQSWQRS